MRGNPEGIISIKSKQEILDVIKIAFKNQINLIPALSRDDFYGTTLTTEGGFILDLTGLKKVEVVRDRYRGMSTDIEPGITFNELNEKLEEEKLRALLPLRMPGDISVLDAYYGKHALLESNKPGYSQDWRLITYQIAIQDGYFIGTGSAGLETRGNPSAFPFSPRADLGRMFLGASGSFGIIGRGTCKLKHTVDHYEFLIAKGDDINYMITNARDIAKKTEAAQAILVADDKCLAAFLSNSIENYDHIRARLDRWNTLIIIGGEEELVQVEKEDILDEARKNSFLLSEISPGTKLHNTIKQQSQKQTNIRTFFDRKPHLKFDFYTTANRIPIIKKVVSRYLQEKNLDEDEYVGFLANSLELGRTYFCEYDFFHQEQEPNPDELPLIGNVTIAELYHDVATLVLDEGGVINVPRNPVISDIIYKRKELANYFTILRKLKYCMDPTNIMHPTILFNGKGGLVCDNIVMEESIK